LLAIGPPSFNLLPYSFIHTPFFCGGHKQASNVNSIAGDTQSDLTLPVPAIAKGIIDELLRFLLPPLDKLTDKAGDSQE